MTTRIIQRCLLVLAFTGVLLSTAEVTTLSEASDTTTQSRETSSSAPEKSSSSAGTSSSYSAVDKKDESSFHPSTEYATSSPKSVASKEKPSKITGDGTSEDSVDSSAASFNSESKEDSHKQEDLTSSLPSVSHSTGLGKAELKDAESSSTEISSRTSTVLVDDNLKEVTNDSKVSDNSESEGNNETLIQASETTSEISDSGKVEETTDVTAMQSTENSFSENVTNDSGQSSVPSKEELISSSSFVVNKQSPEELSSTSPSKVQTEDSETNDTEKSLTKKRSLNATNTMSSSTSTTISRPISSLAPPSATVLSHTVPPSEITEGINYSAEVLVPDDSSSDSINHEEIAHSAYITTRDAMETDLASFPHAIATAVKNSEFVEDAGADHFHESEHMAEVASTGSIQDAHLSSISLAALSTLREESLHPFENIDTAAQILNEPRRISTASSSPLKHSELERNTAEPPHFSVTFDPDGMTHNLSQDPDSVTFTPEVTKLHTTFTFHAIDSPKDGKYFYPDLSHLEHEESVDLKPELTSENAKFTEGTTHESEILGSSFHETEGTFSSEPEKQFLSPSSSGFLPHDEPDTLNMSEKTAPSSELPAENRFSSIEPLDTHIIGTAYSKTEISSNDESEEMLNDSPHFVENQSKSAITPTAEVKNAFPGKNLEMNVGNDITHSTGLVPQNTPETVNELDFSKEYQTDQSEIRPVTAVSPLKISESITALPVPLKVDSHSSETEKSKQPDSVLLYTSSSIILPNPAPTVTNQSAETTTVLLHPGTAAQNSASESSEKSESGTAASTISTITGIAVKTSVSVSLPLSDAPNGTMNYTLFQPKDDLNISSNTSEVILPLPISIHKDVNGHSTPTTVPTEEPKLSTIASTEAPVPSTTVSGGLRIRKPKIKGVDNEPAAPRTRKPFLTPPKPSTTVGPPVPSIFNKARTRATSITSSTTARPFKQFSTIRIHYASRVPGMVPNGELVFSTEPVTTTVPTTTETEEPFSDEPFTEQTQGPIVPSEDNVTLLKVAGYVVLEKGLRWNDQLNNRHSALYKEREKFVQMQLNRLFRTSVIASRLWKIQIDGFSIIRNPRAVAVDFFLYLMKTPNEISMEELTAVFHDKLKNNTFSRFTVYTNKTAFERLDYEPMTPTTESPEEEPEPVIPQWAIAVIVVGAASLIFIVLFAAVAILGRHHMRRRYSSKLNDEDSDRPSDWESKMAAAYENLAADTIYDAEDLHSDTYKKRYSHTTPHGRPSQLRRADSWSSSDWSPPPRRPRPQVHRIVV